MWYLLGGARIRSGVPSTLSIKSSGQLLTSDMGIQNLNHYTLVLLTNGGIWHIVQIVIIKSNSINRRRHGDYLCRAFFGRASANSMSVQLYRLQVTLGFSMVYTRFRCSDHGTSCSVTAWPNSVIFTHRYPSCVTAFVWPLEVNAP